MHTNFKVNYISPADIEKKAQAFLKKYHSSFALPIPIEEIIELKLGMDIIPVPGLQTTASQMGLEIDAFYSHNDDSITVDEFMSQTKKWEPRYRFSLAHEIGHKILHEYIYATTEYDSIDTYRKFINSVSGGILKNAEWQANEFAGRVLLPTQVLQAQFDEAVGSIEAGLELSFSDDPRVVAQGAIEIYLTEVFNVSGDAIGIRLAKEGLIEKWPIDRDFF